jgi:hypothetical protein
MTVAIPTIEPQSITAGDTAAWKKSLGDYPANDSWVLAYTLINATSKITITATASGAEHSVSVAASTTAAWAPGTYTWQSTVTKGAERYTITQGRITILQNLAAATLLDTRSAARKALDAADLALATYGAKAYLQEYQIGDRRQRFADPSSFMAWRDKLRAEVAREDNVARLKAGLAPKNLLFTRFTAR